MTATPSARLDTAAVAQWREDLRFVAGTAPSTDRFFVIIGRSTFSAAQFLVEAVRAYRREPSAAERMQQALEHI